MTRLSHLLFLALLCCLCAPVHAQTGTAVLTGVVRDSATAEPLSGANVVLPSLKRGAQADESGRFRLTNLPPGPLEVRATLVGYRTAGAIVTLANATTTTIVLDLPRVAIPRAEVRVSDRRLTREKAPSVFRLEPKQVRLTAGTLDNPLRTIATYPGVVSTADYSSRVSVRGGGPDQNLVMLDDVQIYNPYRVFGLISAFNPETVSDFTLSGGGFPVRYGDRLSALLLVSNRDGSPMRTPGGSASMSITDANVVFEGPLPSGLGGGETGTWLFSSRRTYYDLIANSIANTTLPSFLDFQGKFTLQPGSRDRLTGFGLLSKERTNATITESGPIDRVRFFNTSHNDVGGVTWSRVKGARVVNRMTGAYYTNRDMLTFNGQFAADSKIRNYRGGEKEAEVIFDRTILVRDASLRDEVGISLNAQNLLTVGGEVHAQRTDLELQIDPESDRNPRVSNPSDIRGGSAAPDTVRTMRPTTRWALFAQNEWTPRPGTRLSGGVRAERSTANNDLDVSPRANMTYALPGGVSARAAWGLFSQTPGYESFLEKDYFVRLDADGPLAIRNEKATHYIVGLERPVGRAWQLSAEGYVKTFRDLIVGRLETDAERDLRLSRYRFPTEYQDEIPTQRLITAFPENGATGVARGVDLYVQKKPRDASDRITGWLSYTYGIANRNAYGRTIPFDYDQRHTLNLVTNIRLGQKWNLATTIKYGSGFPDDPPSGVTIASVTDSLGYIVPDVDSLGYVFWIPRFDAPASLGTARLPSFQELDLRITYTPQWFGRPWSVYLDIINATARTNIIENAVVLFPDSSSDRPRLGTDPLKNFPFLPTIGVSLSW